MALYDTIRLLQAILDTQGGEGGDLSGLLDAIKTAAQATQAAAESTDPVPVDLSDLSSGTAAFTTVNSGTVSVAILAANASRKGAIIVNTDANALYLDLSGGTAAATRRAKKLAQDEAYEVPFGYTGLITGVWAADGSGAALVTEFS